MEMNETIFKMLEKHIKMYTNVYFGDNMNGKVKTDAKSSRRKPPQETYPISTRVPISMLKAIDSVIESGKYLRISDYLRDLVRKDLEERDIEIK